MKHLTLAIIILVSLTACNKTIMNRPTDNPTVTTPTVPGGGGRAEPLICSDSHASNMGQSAPCQCNANYQISMNGLSCLLNPATIGSITISPSELPLMVAGTALTLNLAVEDTNGDPMIVSNSDVLWTVDPNLGSVVDGVFYAHTAGTANITASIGSEVSNTLSVVITGTIINQIADRIEIRPTLGAVAANGQ